MSDILTETEAHENEPSLRISIPGKGVEEYPDQFHREIARKYKRYLDLFASYAGHNLMMGMVECELANLCRKFGEHNFPPQLLVATAAASVLHFPILFMPTDLTYYVEWVRSGSWRSDAMTLEQVDATMHHLLHIINPFWF